MSRKWSKTSRRNVLSALATSGSVLGLAGSASARRRRRKRDSFKEIVERSKQIRKETGSVSEWMEYLENHGISGKVKSHRIAVSDGNSGGFSTQHIGDPSYLDISIGMVRYCLNYHAELFWSYKPESYGLFHEGGQPPEDAAGLFFAHDWWNLDGDTVDEALSTSKYVEYQDGSNGGDGPGFKVHDRKLFVEGAESDRHYCGIYIKPTGDYAENERQVHGEYTHTWNDENVEVSSISVSWPAGVSLSFSTTNTVKEWTTDTEDDGNTFLAIKQSEAPASCF